MGRVSWPRRSVAETATVAPPSPKVGAHVSVRPWKRRHAVPEWLTMTRIGTSSPT